MADRYILRVTAGPDYDLATHTEVPVNHHDPLKISSEKADIELNVRISNYQGLPYGSPVTSPYFDTEPHKYNQDQYSICFRFTPKKFDTQKTGKKTNDVDGSEEDEEENEGISGHDLQFGNDFDRPIRDRLPPGFNTALGIVRWWIDPGLDGDAYADRPYLYGPALSSFNALHVGPAEFNPEKGGIWVQEGGDEEARGDVGAPADSKGRMKWALSEAAKDDWVWEYGNTYAVDFFNPYLDFANLTLRLPGFHLPIMKYWDGQGLRYVLRNKTSGEIYLAVCFTLYLKEDVNEDGTLKEGVDGTETATVEKVETADAGEEFDEQAALKQAREKLAPKQGETETSTDDID